MCEELCEQLDDEFTIRAEVLDDEFDEAFLQRLCERVTYIANEAMERAANTLRAALWPVAQGLVELRQGTTGPSYQAALRRLNDAVNALPSTCTS